MHRTDIDIYRNVKTRYTLSMMKTDEKRDRVRLPSIDRFKMIGWLESVKKYLRSPTGGQHFTQVFEMDKDQLHESRSLLSEGQ